MPLDKAKARGRVNGARSHYRFGIHSEFINLMADDLEEALNLLDSAALETTRAKNEAARLERELDNEKTEYRKLREKSEVAPAPVADAPLALLREIAASPKGAQKKAAAFLKTITPAEPVIENLDTP